MAGVRPVGYRAPWWETNWHTPRLLAERGFLYDSSLLDGDKPYRFAVEPGSAETLIEIPVDWALDDWEQYAFYPGVIGSGIIESPAKVLEMWTLEAEAHHLEGGCFVLTNHPFISGRPSKAVALERLIENVKAMDGMWVTTLGEIAAHARERVHRDRRAHQIRGADVPGRGHPPNPCTIRPTNDAPTATVVRRAPLLRAILAVSNHRRQVGRTSAIA